MSEPDLELKSLSQFYGTQQYYNVFGVKVTEGVKYIMDNGYSWFVTDFIAVIKFREKFPKLRNQPFLSVKLKLCGDVARWEGDLIIEDGNYNELYRQHYDFTDAKRELTLFFTDNVLMLNSEY
jgi:hypothetical protein